MRITDTIVALWIWNKISLLSYTARSIADSLNRNTHMGPVCIVTDDGADGCVFLGSGTNSAEQDAVVLISSLKPCS